MTEETTVDGNQIDLSDGRHVFVATKEDRFLIQFQNAKGEKTWLALSREAGDALRYLLGQHVKPEDMVKRFLMIAAQVDGGKKSEMHWQAVELDTGPVAANP